MPKISEEIERELERIKNDREKGASELLLDSIRVLQKASEETEDKTILLHLCEQIEKLRPTMVVLTNNMKMLRKKIESEGIKAIGDYTYHLTRMRERVLKNASFLKGIPITCSFSSLVRDALTMLMPSSILAMKSTVGSISYGEKFREIFGERVKVIEDERVTEEVQKADYGLIGADAISSDGRIVNGTPSLLLAKACHSSNVPLYVITTLDRFTEKIETGLEKGFDVIPARFIKSFITEKGILNYQEFTEIAKSLFT